MINGKPTVGIRRKGLKFSEKEIAGNTDAKKEVNNHKPVGAKDNRMPHHTILICCFATGDLSV